MVGAIFGDGVLHLSNGSVGLSGLVTSAVACLDQFTQQAPGGIPASRPGAGLGFIDQRLDADLPVIRFSKQVNQQATGCP